MPPQHTTKPQPEDANGPKLLSFEFFSICAISVLAFCNISIFYGFYSYLTDLGIPPAWRGPLMALEPLTALLVRPFLARYLSLKNAVQFMRVGMGLATLALLCYPLATTIPTLACVRVLHGMGFVTVVSGLMGTLMAFLPRQKSAQGFGLFSVTILLPYAIMPPFVELLLPHIANHGMAYALAAPLMLPAFLLLVPLGKRVCALAATLPQSHLERPGWDEVRQALKTGGVLLLVGANFFLVAAHSIVFFFMRDFAAGIGTGNPGAFFTCANAATISVRVLGGNILDRVNKGRTLVITFVWLGLLVPLFAHAWRPAALLCMAALYGTGMALTMPLVNASMFSISPARLRAYNANLLMIAVDAGFFVGPFLGGAIMAGELGHAWLFGVGGALMLGSALCALPVARIMRRAESQAEQG